jgi:hypothetical protein
MKHKVAGYHKVGTGHANPSDINLRAVFEMPGLLSFSSDRRGLVTAVDAG